MKAFSVFFIFFVICCAYAYEDNIPNIPYNYGMYIQYIDDDSSLINTDKIKKRTRIIDAQNKANDNSIPKIKLDAKQINLQRALDYTTRQNNSMIPIF